MLKFISRSHVHTVVWECCKGDHQSQWKRATFDSQLTQNPLTDRYQILITWLRRGYLLPKNWGQSVQGVLLPVYAKYAPSNFRMFSFFLGPSARLQARPLGGFRRSIRHTTRLCARKCFLGVRKFKCNIYLIYSKNSKKLQWRLCGKF